ncbi:phosphate-starvation-inducible protein PsiE [Erythrobacter crassostreae]|uniref:Protein PsiE n=1 Tax=Erythrobacter crassostreae TaxID=2828328 RepID=A0A9X1JK53_9SPHN|nr:phosphate-starvation-inducible PsiE family protein [Erythrobacter crassostrea]MBV7258640.1 phosphate-starvation-inducible PsiE family protein [Erythrobacter crassostrea]
MAATESKPEHPELDSEKTDLAGRGFSLAEKILLIVAAVMTLVAAGAEVVSVYQRGSIDLADILLMFLYTEVIGMIAVFYTGKGSFFIYPIFIAITALARLIVLQGKDMAPENVLYEAGAILLLSFAALVLSRTRSP